jgi:hypothetical protein
MHSRRELLGSECAALCVSLLSADSLRPPDRQLNMHLEVLCSVREGSTNPGFKTRLIGLFQGMFDKNILTFNPGWDRSCATLPDYDDVRDIQRTLTSRGLAKADESTTGPASLVLVDPDGNQILIDQHVPSPRK